jgi:outer membrane protein assembly factor BamB
VALVAALAAVALSGCWLQPGFGPERQSSNLFETSLTAANVDRLEQVWSVPINFGSQPLVAGATAYTGGQRIVGGEPFLTVLAVDRRSGTPRWQRDLPNGASGIGTVLSVAHGQVLTARLADGALVFETLDVGTGATIATVTEPRHLDPAAMAVSDTLVAYRGRTLSGPTELVVRRRDTMAVLWTAPIESGAVARLDPVLIVGDHVYVHVEPAGVQGVGEIRAFAAGGCGAASTG